MLVVLNLQDIAKDFSNYHDKTGYYAETGSCKPFSKSTIYAMEKKGYITIEGTACDDTIFYLKHGKNFDLLPKVTYADYQSAR
jgi:hypothetical protein